MIEFSNSEDQRVWSCLEEFNLGRVAQAPKVKVDLYLAIISALGYCSKCSEYNPATFRCRGLSTFTRPEDRCSDFSPKSEGEEEDAFSIMHEKFRIDQENVRNLSQIKKYTKRPNPIRKDEKKGESNHESGSTGSGRGEHAPDQAQGE